MVKIESVINIMEKFGDKAPYFDFSKRNTNIFLFNVWRNDPLLCRNTVNEDIVLATVHPDGLGRLYVRDLLDDKMISITGTVFKVEAKFDNWGEARDYFRYESIEEGDSYDLYSKSAHERYMKHTIAVIQ